MLPRQANKAIIIKVSDLVGKKIYKKIYKCARRRPMKPQHRCRRVGHPARLPTMSLPPPPRVEWPRMRGGTGWIVVGIADGLRNPVWQPLFRQGMAPSMSCMANKQRVWLPESSCHLDVCPQCPYWAQQSLTLSPSLSPVLSRWCKGCQTEGLIYIRCGKGPWQEWRVGP